MGRRGAPNPLWGVLNEFWELSSGCILSSGDAAGDGNMMFKHRISIKLLNEISFSVWMVGIVWDFGNPGQNLYISREMFSPKLYVCLLSWAFVLLVHHIDPTIFVCLVIDDVLCFNPNGFSFRYFISWLQQSFRSGWCMVATSYWSLPQPSTATENNKRNWREQNTNYKIRRHGWHGMTNIWCLTCNGFGLLSLGLLWETSDITNIIVIVWW